MEYFPHPGTGHQVLPVTRSSRHQKLTPPLLFLSGMVLVRTEMGQLVMVPQQVLAQAQAKVQQGQTVANITQRPATPTATTTIRVSTATTVSHWRPERWEPLGSGFSAVLATC